MYETQRALINQRRGGSRWLRRHGEARSLRSEKGLKRTLGVIARRATNCGTVCTRGIISISIWARNGEGDAGRVLVTGCSSRDMRGRIILHVRRFLIYESTAQCAVFKTYLSWPSLPMAPLLPSYVCRLQLLHRWISLCLFLYSDRPIASLNGLYIRIQMAYSLSLSLSLSLIHFSSVFLFAVIA